MTWATAIVLIVLIGAIAFVMAVRGTAGTQRDGAIVQDDEATPREAELEHEVEELRERIHVLERIATDANSSESRNSQDIAREIERLREPGES